jgi:transposase-like protein
MLSCSPREGPLLSAQIKPFPPKKGQGLSALPMEVFMLRAFMSICKSLKADDLDALALAPVNCDLSVVVCPHCKARGSLDAHDSYKRNIVYLKDDAAAETRIVIRRLICKSCDKTHALLPEGVVPYSPFSVRFIARIIIDWIKQRFSSIEGLCEHYRIALNTFYRLRKRFLDCVMIALGVTGTKDKAVKVASLLLSDDLPAVDSFLEMFFKLTNRSFCQVAQSLP